MGPASLSSLPTLEQNQEGLVIVMECCDGKLSKAPVPKKCKPIPEIPQIMLPFPPIISAREIFEEIFEKSLERNKHKASNSKNSTDFAGKKAPNKFLIYRKICVEELHRLNSHLSMTDISGFIANKWNNEPKYVKDEYSRIAAEIDCLRKQRFGTDSRKKSKRGQVKTFSAPVNSVNNTYPIPNEYYGNVGNVHVQEHLDPNNFMFPYNNINNITDNTSQHISHHIYPQPSLYQPIYIGDYKPEPPNYVNVNLSDGYPSMVGTVV